MTLEALREKIVEKLHLVFDPEIPVNIYDLGLIYGIDCTKQSDATRCVITMTLTSATCPVSESLVDQVRNIRYLIDEVPDLVIEPNLVFDPPWTMEKMSDEAKLHLGML